MIRELKRLLYRKKLELLFRKGLEDEKILPFSDSDYEQMSDTYIGGVPIAFYIKYFKPKTPPGHCYDRSLGMFFCFDDAILVRADTKNLELEYGEDGMGHGWIETDDYVYDPSLLLKIEKELYYQMYQPYNVYKITKDDYLSIPTQKEFYCSITQTKLKDYQPFGKKRYELLTNIPILLGIKEKTNDEEFIADLDRYLEKIEYDEEKIHDEIKIILDGKIKGKKKVG